MSKNSTKNGRIGKAFNPATPQSHTVSFDRIENQPFRDEFVTNCKIAFEDDDKQLEAVFSLFHSILKMFTSIEISDDYGLWNSFADSKRFKIQLRELTTDETARVKTLYNEGFTFFKDLLWKMIADDLGVPNEKLEYPDYEKTPELHEGKLYGEYGEVSELEFATAAV